MFRSLILIGTYSLLSAGSFAQCGGFPTLDLGNDVVLCQGQAVDFTVPPGYDYFSWNIVSGNPTSVTVSTPTTVILNVQNVTTTNLVVNGDFESGNTGFTTQYTVGMGGPWGLVSNPATYAITTSPQNAHSNFAVCADHGTGAPGNMMVVNGAGTPNIIVWEETVTVDPNTDYNFSAWVMSVQNNNIPISQLQFSVNDVLIGPVFSPSGIACDWQQFFETWSSGASTSATIRIVNQNTSASGNDFAMDDISFIPVCTQSDTVEVTMSPDQINAGTDVAFCENEPETVTATANFPNPNFTWETGATTATISPMTTGYYTVTATGPSGCVLTDSVLVDVTAMPWDFDLVESQPTSCGVNSGVVYVTTAGTFNDPPSYNWHGPGSGNSNNIDASVWQNLPSGWYYIEIESDGCYRYDSVFVDVTNPPVSQVNGSPLNGDAPLIVNFTNTSSNGEDYEWNFGNGNSTTATDLSGQTQTYDTPGTYQVMLVTNQGNCSDTSYVTVVVNEPPVPPIPPVIVPVNINVPNVFTPNGDDANDFFEFDLLNIKEIHVEVVNRWGEVVFSSDAVDFKWDGTVGSLDASEGVYTYTYTAKGAQDENLEGQGFVQLFR